MKIKSKILKRILKTLLVLFFLICILMVTPRIWSALNPSKPPVGYIFEPADYLAVGIGLEKLVNLKPDIPADIEEIKNIEYKNINGKSLQLDIYKPEDIKTKAPLLVFFHGGGWKGGNRADYLVYLIAFAKRGYITATVSYRLLNDSPYPACVEDITDAVKWFFRNGETYGYDPDRIALIGGSAGAHLAMLAAYGWGNSDNSADSITSKGVDHKIKAIVDIYGPYDLTTDYARSQPLVTSFIAHSYEETPELYREASPKQYIDKNDPPTLIFQGTSDNLVPVSQSDNLKAHLDSLGVPCVYYRLPFWPHAMDVALRVNEYCQLKMEDFFKQNL